jgi:hypothetical protein
MIDLHWHAWNELRVHLTDNDWDEIVHAVIKAGGTPSDRLRVLRGLAEQCIYRRAGTLCARTILREDQHPTTEQRTRDVARLFRARRSEKRAKDFVADMRELLKVRKDHVGVLADAAISADPDTPGEWQAGIEPPDWQRNIAPLFGETGVTIGQGIQVAGHLADMGHGRHANAILTVIEQRTPTMVQQKQIAELRARSSP